jgi:hypothetical protein
VARALLLAVLAVLALAAPAQARDVLIVFHPGGGAPAPGRDEPATVFERLSARPALALGFVQATQGRYSRRQALLDLGAGRRTSRSGYEPPEVPRYRVRGGRVEQWDAVVARARTAPGEIVPGLLAGSIPGGAAFVGLGSRVDLEGVLAAGTDGTLAKVSLGPRRTLTSRIEKVLAAHALAIAILPRGRRGDAALDALLSRRPADRLILVIRRPPRSEEAQMLPSGAAGLAGDGGLLTSRTTRREGLVASHDVAPTVLGWLGIAIPPAVNGRRITTAGARDVGAVRRMERRLRLVSPRRGPVLLAATAAVAAAALALVLAGGPAGRRTALRTVGLAVLWAPTVSLACAALAPPRGVELALMGAGVVALALATDRWVRWPAAPALPCLVGVVAHVVDLGFGSDMIVRSLFGPNPRFGARFYGIGNELEALLPPLLLVGIAAAAGRRPRSRGLAALVGVAMLALGAAIGAGRLGADVGGVITVGAGGAVAVLLLAPGPLTGRRVAIAVAVPLVAVAALAVVDLATGGDAHFTTTVLGAEDADALWEVARRRYSLAWDALWRGAMPLQVALAAGLVVWALRRREAWYGRLRGRPAWAAALMGGLAGGVAGALANDSGPVLFTMAVWVLAATTAYLVGEPERPRVLGSPERPRVLGASAPSDV